MNKLYPGQLSRYRLDYKLDNWVQIQFPAEARDLSLLDGVQIDSEVHSASYRMCPRLYPWEQTDWGVKLTIYIYVYCFHCSLVTDSYKPHPKMFPTEAVDIILRKTLYLFVLWAVFKK